MVYPKANIKMGDYFFNVYGQFVIKKKKTLLFRLFRCHCSFFHSFVTIVVLHKTQLLTYN